jgi:hydrogenase maturation protease
VIAPTLVFGWGNPSRGDDALGPLLIDRLGALLPGRPDWGAVDLLTDFQLQVEHALDLEGRVRVLFADACAGALPGGAGEAPFGVAQLAPARDNSFSSHALSPQAVMQVYVDVTGRPPPPCWLLGIKAERFELGEDPGAAARANLEAAVAWVAGWLAQTGDGRREGPRL